MAVRLTEHHFELLGITRQATRKEIKGAYRLQMSLWHPDKFHNNSAKRALAEERSKSINEAYELLKVYSADNYITERPAKENYQKTERKHRTTSSNGAEKVFINSSNVLSICYVSQSKTLIVDFVNGSIYEYYDVPIHTYNEFLNAASKGKFVHTNLRAFQYSAV